jgi:hypothetical protein
MKPPPSPPLAAPLPLDLPAPAPLLLLPDAEHAPTIAPAATIIVTTLPKLEENHLPSIAHASKEISEQPNKADVKSHGPP